jgi:hypothetical protein
MALFLPMSTEQWFKHSLSCSTLYGPAPISHLRPVRWGLFSILKISAVFEQEASYDD